MVYGGAAMHRCACHPLLLFFQSKGKDLAVQPRRSSWRAVIRTLEARGQHVLHAMPCACGWFEHAMARRAQVVERSGTVSRKRKRRRESGGGGYMHTSALTAAR